MAPIDIVWLVATLLLISTVVLLVRTIRKERRRSNETLAQSAGAWSSQHDQTVATHRDELGRAHSSYLADRQKLDAAIVSAGKRVEAYRRRMSYRIGWELRSRRKIVDACDAAGLSGAVATNVVFEAAAKAPGRTIIAQVDHVLITERFALVIEHKGWKGIVFDGTQPGAVHRGFEALLGGRVREDDFAIQIDQLDTTDGSLGVMKKLGSASPRAQVRRQALRLSTHLKHLGLEVPWLHTCVFYAHPGVDLYAAPGQQKGRVHTHAVSRGEELVEILADLAADSARQTRVDVRALADRLHHDGADVIGVGTFHDAWAFLPDPPVQHGRSNPRRSTARRHHR